MIRSGCLELPTVLSSITVPSLAAGVRARAVPGAQQLPPGLLCRRGGGRQGLRPGDPQGGSALPLLPGPFSPLRPALLSSAQQASCAVIQAIAPAALAHTRRSPCQWGSLVQIRGPDAPTNFPASEYAGGAEKEEEAAEEALQPGASASQQGQAAHLLNLPQGVVRSITIPQRQLSQVGRPLRPARSSCSIQAAALGRGFRGGPCDNSPLKEHDNHTSSTRIISNPAMRCIPA